MTGVHEIFDTAIDIAVRGEDDVPEEAETRPGTKGQNGMPLKKKKRSNCKIL